MLVKKTKTKRQSESATKKITIGTSLVMLHRNHNSQISPVTWLAPCATTEMNDFTSAKLLLKPQRARTHEPILATGLSLHVPVRGHPWSAVKSTITAVRGVMTRLGRLVTAMAKDRDRS